MNSNSIIHAGTVLNYVTNLLTNSQWAMSVEILIMGDSGWLFTIKNNHWVDLETIFLSIKLKWSPCPIGNKVIERSTEKSHGKEYGGSSPPLPTKI